MTTYTRYEDIDWATWIPREQATLLFVIEPERILLIEKKRGLGAGKINGPGGRIDPGETPQQGAIRECQEELCITPGGVRKAGELWFQFTNGYSLRGHVFRADHFEGVPTETDEAKPLWTPLNDIPYHRMWADDRIWIPLMLKEQPFEGRFLFDDDAMLGFELR
ncbi:MAG TPA: 8-oxo-dGTP diphosphatase [Kiritimatiellia bacterium]|nr:8-oxo-dGTP diphosphatase [Kiritimatiellia bacterium]